MAASIIIVELMARGVLAAIGHQFDNTADAIEAVKLEVISMKGSMEKFRRDMDEELSHLNDRLDEVFHAIQRLEYTAIREQMINTMESVQDSSVRERVLQVSMVLYSLIHNTEIQEISIQVNRTLAPASSSEEGYEEPLISNTIEAVGTTTSASQIAKKVMRLDREGLFSGVDHRAEDPLHIVINSASDENAKKNELIIATGALYILCQTLCVTIQDYRGVYATALGDGTFVQSETSPHDNACHISLRYCWPTPVEFRRVEEFVQDMYEASGEAELSPIIEVIEERQKELRIRNVYLVGETGEGKSTLGNDLIGTEEFYVSDAGTGTVKICGHLATPRGLLGGTHEVMVWDTPGMNDQQGRDRIYEGLLYQHLTRENTVSTIIIVSKDGSRIPNTLINTMEVYRRAFGDAFTSSICVCIGMNQRKTKETKISAKFNFWANTLCEILRIPEGSLHDKIIFYNADDEEPQPNQERLKQLILNAEVRLTGTGVAILQGLQKMRTAKLKQEEKEAMFRASEEVCEAIRGELWNAPRVRFKRYPNFHGKASSISLEILPLLGTRFRAYFRHYILWKDNEEEEKAIIFNGIGERAVELLSKKFLTNPEIYHGAKINLLTRYARKHELIVVNVGSKTRKARRGKIQEQTYNLLHLEDELDTSVYDEVDEILRVITVHPHYAATFGTFIPETEE